MTRIIDFIKRFDRKTLLLVGVAFLLLLNVVRLAAGYYNNQRLDVENQQSLFEK